MKKTKELSPGGQGQSIICGIDLGTTNSCISYLKDGKPFVIAVEGSSPILPSVVSFDEQNGRMLVGREAINRLSVYPHHTVRSIKRQMGKDTTVQLGSKELSPAEVSSFILRRLIEKAQQSTGLAVKQAVITVPAYFNDAQRRATITAGELAGVEVLRIVNEPTAASLVYDYVTGIDTLNTPYILVYDLGGGTFDVSILEIRGEIKEVLASCGDTNLGGDDFDQRLIDMFMRHLEEKTGVTLSAEELPLQVRLKDIAERTKIALSDSPYVNVKEASVTRINGESVNLNLEVSRDEYETMIKDLVDKTIDKVNEALREAGLSSGEISEVLLVGGATRTPLVQRSIDAIFDIPIQHSVDPDLCVALGAAVQGGLIIGQPLGHILLDVTSHSLGVKTADNFDFSTGEADHFSVIIRRNTKIPVRRAESYYTMVHNQEGVNVEVYQGESISCKDNTLIGEFFFELKPAPENSTVTTEFAYDKEGIVHITVDQKGYDNRKEVTLDVRTRKIKDKDAANGGDDEKVLNYIISKYKALCNKEDIDKTSRNELIDIGERYERALRDKEDDKVIDDLEASLIELIEEIEESLEDLE
ncbi:MAG: Hsp70 family protein [Nitrospirae bacterium]|uniref:Hsp70 family protein n=1 Tax=Candidatus Magnetobacterium casense TaxID=1455061 RepID=UPI0009DF700C|nr:Hsp70 family protein [Candidatus Magnetobacterium casensis]MBF0337866.1 Hsp70 family protein [Nitrospirota bacterium]